MKTALGFAVAVCSLRAALAQSPDFTGIYEGASLIVEPEVYPLTAAGEQSHSAYDPLFDDPRQSDDCAPETLPSVLWAGTLNTMRLYNDGGNIMMHVEHGGAVRSILMDVDVPVSDQPNTELGISVGRWDDDVLTVETSNLTGGVVFTNRGYPVSEDARITERYWRDGDDDLQLELVLVDPANYTEPVTITREWLWAPEEKVIPWNCVSLGSRDEEPDIDEIRRLLNQL